jgi:hypothetical protein
VQNAEPFDSTRPNVARVWDYWLGGKDNFAVDRELADELLAIHPVSAQMAQENRRFLGRSVRYVAARGIEQFIDLGAGLPTALNTHDIAQSVTPQARVAYVDNDAVVIAHGRSLLARSPSVIVVPGDVREPHSILADPELTGHVDLTEPTCIILSAILHFSDSATAKDIAAAYIEAMAPGSYLIVSVGSGNQSEGGRFASAYTAAQIHIHSPEDLATFFGDLDLVEPGVVPVGFWRGDEPAVDRARRIATFLCGVGRKQ